MDDFGRNTALGDPKFFRAQRIKIENLILIHVNKYQSPVFGHLKTTNHTIR